MNIHNILFCKFFIFIPTLYYTLVYYRVVHYIVVYYTVMNYTVISLYNTGGVLCSVFCLRSSVFHHKFCIQHLFCSASSFSFIYPTVCPVSPLVFLSEIFCVMTSIFALRELIYCDPPLAPLVDICHHPGAMDALIGRNRRHPRAMHPSHWSKSTVTVIRRRCTKYCLVPTAFC